MAKNIFFFFLCSLYMIFCIPVFSQEAESGGVSEQLLSENSNKNYNAEENGSSETIYVINSINFEIDGYTKPYALLYHGELTEGENIKGLSNLQKFIRDKQQLLYNQRVLESVRILYTIGEEREDGKHPVDLVIYVKDTWNIMAIPRPKIDSNTGFDITLKARDYNFLGTMSPLRVDVGYQYDQEGKHYISSMIDSDIPFKLFGLNWNFDFDHFYTYRPNFDEPHYYRNNTGLSVELPIKNTILSVGVTESFFNNQENPLRYRKELDEFGNEYGRIHHGLYMSTNPYISWKIPTGLFYSDLGEVNYTPSLSAAFVHEFEEWPLPDFRKGPFITFSHNFSFGRINWIGNFQSGATARLGNSFSYNFYKLRHDEQPWGTNISVRAIGHKKIIDFMGISARIMYRHYFYDDYNDEAGDALRGILDNKVKANAMLSFNFDLPIRVFKFRPSGWSKNNKVLRIFDFDFHAAPIIDFALYEYNNPDDIKNQKVFGLENLLLTAGMEIIIFPERWRSLFLRISYGRNFSPGKKSNTDEIFIGTEFHY